MLWRAARPDRKQVTGATLWLGVAGLLDAAGPLFGKHLIDTYLIPHVLDLAMMGWLVAGYLVTGALATIIRYFQLVRLAGLAMRSVRRLRESVYAHVLRLPMAFFDRAITGVPIGPGTVRLVTASPPSSPIEVDLEASDPAIEPYVDLAAMREAYRRFLQTGDSAAGEAA